jgi:Bax protein
MIHLLINKNILLSILLLCLLLASCTDSVAPVYQGSGIQVLEQSAVVDLEKAFQHQGYQLDKLENGVPPLILLSLPKDLPQLRSKQEKKRIFFKSLLPMILLANEEISQEREQLQRLNRTLEQDLRLHAPDLRQLANLAKRYHVKNQNREPSQVIDELLQRVDVIPPELALAQAANESAWGTSRFSQLANNLFGEWTFVPGTGIVPEDRPEGATYEVRRFASVYESVRAYLRNLNTHSAYQELRRMRAEARAANTPLDGVKLAEGLVRYSIRGQDYVSDLQSLILQNRLSRFANASLRLRS